MLGIGKTVRDQQNAIITMLHLMDKFIEQREEQAKLHNRKMTLPPMTKSPRRLGSGTVMRLPAARRFSFSAKVLIHKNDRYIKGRAVNISATGMFVGVDRKVFREHEKVRLYIRPEGMSKSYRAVATVVRFQDQNGREGYGLRFSTFAHK